MRLFSQMLGIVDELRKLPQQSEFVYYSPSTTLVPFPSSVITDSPWRAFRSPCCDSIIAHAINGVVQIPVHVVTPPCKCGIVWMHIFTFVTVIYMYHIKLIIWSYNIYFTITKYNISNLLNELYLLIWAIIEEIDQSECECFKQRLLLCVCVTITLR